MLTFASTPSPSIVTGPSTSIYPILVKSSVIAADPCAKKKNLISQTWSVIVGTSSTFRLTINAPSIAYISSAAIVNTINGTQFLGPSLLLPWITLSLSPL